MTVFENKRVYICVFIIIGLILLIGCQDGQANNSSGVTESPLIGDSSEEYYMVTFNSGIEYWKNCYKGFEDAGRHYGVKTIYTGSPQYDVNQQVTVLEQVIAKKPAGIAVTCMNPDAFAAPIKKAIDAGIPVVTFDADSPNSGRYSFLGTGNVNAGGIAAKALAEQLGPDGGDVGVITLPGQLNHDQRVEGFIKTLELEYDNINVVQIGNGRSDQTESARVLAGMLQAYPNLKGVFCTDATSGVGAAAAVREAGKVGRVKIVSFDTDVGTLDAIKAGVISASIAQGTYIMGYQSMNFLYHIKHDLVNPTEGWKDKGINPLPPYVDTGVSVITIENVESFYQE